MNILCEFIYQLHMDMASDIKIDVWKVDFNKLNEWAISI